MINSNLGPISHHVSDTATYWLKIASFPYPCLVDRPLSKWPFSNLGKALRLLKLESFSEMKEKTSWF